MDGKPCTVLQVREARYRMAEDRLRIAEAQWRHGLPYLSDPVALCLIFVCLVPIFYKVLKIKKLIIFKKSFTKIYNFT